jgi:ribosomal protein S18 acetylase RimI-like enzyme
MAREGPELGRSLPDSGGRSGVADKVRIRTATPGDADAIAEVFIASFDTLTFLPRLHTNAETLDFIANKVLREQEVLVAEENGGIVGFTAMAHGNFLEHLYVHPDSQGRGIGSGLLARAKERMPGGFRLWVFQQNTQARRFYERHGLRVIELTEGAGNEEQMPDALYEWRSDA